MTTLHLQCTEWIHGNYRLDVVDQLQENPGVVLRRILIPLKQKHKEWVICMKTVQKGSTAKGDFVMKGTIYFFVDFVFSYITFSLSRLHMQ